MASNADQGCAKPTRQQLLGELTGSRGALRPTRTTVTRVDGSRLVEAPGGQGQPEQCAATEAIPVHVQGYVVDNEEDLNVGNPMPSLYISSWDVAIRPELLAQYGITHVLNLTMAPNVAPSELHLQHLHMKMEDDLDQKLDFDGANDFIDVARCTGGKVLVHCSAGVSRSGAVVAAYIIRERRVSPTAAIQLIRQTRWVQPNDSFVKQLDCYHAMLEATW